MRFLLLVVMLSSCAAIFGSKQKNFDLRSNPPGAEVFLDGARLGTTPFKVKLGNQQQHTFVFRKEGYKEVSCTLPKGTGGGWVVADILLGLVPVIIDAATNSWSQTKGDSCAGSLEPMSVASVTPAAAPAPTTVDAARAATVPVSAASNPPPATQSGMVPVNTLQVPVGTKYVADYQRHVYIAAGCPAAARIPEERRYFFQSESEAAAEGYSKSASCE
jgi:hypothetical protein